MADFSGFSGFEIDPDDDEIFEEEAEFEEPEIEDIFQRDNQNTVLRERFGNDRLSKPVLGKLAVARLIAARTAKLQLGAPSRIPRERLRSNKLNEIAVQELNEKVIPIKIRRNFADGTFERWDISEFKFIVKDTQGRSERSRRFRSGVTNH